MADPAALARQILSSGGDTSKISDGSPMSEATPELVVRDSDSTVDGEALGEGSSGDTPTDSQGTTSADAKAGKSTAPSETSGTKEVITVTDESGRRRKVEIDYTDRAAIKKAHELATGARKWQAERDREIQSRKALESQHGEIKSNWDTLEQAFKAKGVEGIVDLLEGRSGAFKDHISKQVQRAKFLESANPEELDQFKKQEAVEQTKQELERERQENAKFRKEMLDREERSELKSMESRVHPAFNKHRFSGQLDNPEDEHMFDEMLWGTALKRLEPYEEKGLDITPELVDREFARVAKSIRSRIGVQAEKKATKAVEQKKQEATENAQAKAMSGYKNSSTQKEAQDLLNTGNLTGIFKQWGKYGKLFR